jgi:hypothetical protein
MRGEAKRRGKLPEWVLATTRREADRSGQTSDAATKISLWENAIRS